MTVTIRIDAVRGTTEYHFETYHSGEGGDYGRAEQDAADFERWLAQQPVRFARYDNEVQGAQ